MKGNLPADKAADGIPPRMYELLNEVIVRLGWSRNLRREKRSVVTAVTAVQ
jgi:hypothetical protein